MPLRRWLKRWLGLEEAAAPAKPKPGSRAAGAAGKTGATLIAAQSVPPSAMAHGATALVARSGAPLAATLAEFNGALAVGANLRAAANTCTRHAEAAHAIGVTTEETAAWRDAAVVSRDVTSQFDAPLAVLPRYPHDAHYGGFADTDLPLLMLQGTWDPATRPGPASVLAQAYTGAAQHWVEIPRGAHGALQSVPMLDGRSCGTLLVLGFLADPKGPLDTSCLTQLAPLTFDGTPALNTLLFGTEDAWGGL